MANGAVTRLMELVWHNSQKATEHSWGRLNTAMRKTLTLAVGAGLEFGVEDFKELERFRPAYWIGDSGGEWVYSMAIAEGNTSAAVAFEKWKGREPIIADEVDPAERHDNFAHASGRRQQERLHVGCYFHWKGLKVKVTSFTEAGEAIAVAYHPAKGQYDHERRVARKFKITRECVITDRAERKEKAEIQKELFALVESKVVKDVATILDALGAKTKEEFAALSVAKVRKVAAKFLKLKNEGAIA